MKELASCLQGNYPLPIKNAGSFMALVESSRRLAATSQADEKRGTQVAMFLESRGYANLFNLQGGIDSWSRQAYPSIPTY
ncbi:hypothetical protein BH160DRAFT_4315 [Burkholderia sp. H160]|nr:hypothetical protein BH160DRAFT_4315 [Burkholderia sp. H160]